MNTEPEILIRKIATLSDRISLLSQNTEFLQGGPDHDHVRAEINSAAQKLVKYSAKHAEVERVRTDTLSHPLIGQNDVGKIIIDFVVTGENGRSTASCVMSRCEADTYIFDLKMSLLTADDYPTRKIFQRRSSLQYKQE